MGLAILGDVLNDWSAYALDDTIYVTAGREPAVDDQVAILSFEPNRGRRFEGREYLLEIDLVRDVVEGLEAQLGRTATSVERLRAVVHYARNDAFIDPIDAVGGE